MTEKMNLNNLDKSNWQRYRFDQIAKNISERVDPNNTDLNIYVGLEHIDSESLHITRTGTADDVNGQKLRFYPGDIIFGRRRAYQRKAAIATTDGFCSAHALVLRANPEVIDPKLFPFFMHSDQFMHRAVDISVGSLSPTINWGSLKHQEFVLPPKEQQPELLQTLLLYSKSSEAFLGLKNKFEIFYHSKINSFFTEVSKSSDYISEVPLKNFYRNEFKTINVSKLNIKEIYHYSLPSFMENNTPEVVGVDKIQSNKILITSDVILFSKLNPNNPKIWSIKNQENIVQVGSTEWLPIIPYGGFSQEYLYAFVSSDIFIKQVMKYVQGTSNSHKRIDPARFYGLKVPKFSKNKTAEIVECSEVLLNASNEFCKKHMQNNIFFKKLINQVF